MNKWGDGNVLVSRPSAWKLGLLVQGRRVASNRRGVSILEVLFAIAVTTIGLLGAIAVFPVASAQARKGRISDAIAVAGMSAAHDFDVRGMRQPSNWVGFDNTGAVLDPYTLFGSFIKAESQAIGSGNADHNYFSGRYMFCIDPLYLAANQSSLNKAFSFPASNASSSAITIAGETQKRMYRVSLQAPNSGAINKAVAESLFMFDDDLTFERPDDRSLNAYQIFDEISPVKKRQADGHMSWMATLVPVVERHSTAHVNNYVLSVVVFYDRPMDDLATDDLSDGSSEAEHQLTVVSMPGSGVTGGEVELRSTDQATMNRIQANDWILLRGNWNIALSGGGTHKVPFARWYRVVSAEAEAEQSGSNYTKLVTLFGQDWDTSLDNIDAVYVDGVIGVYEKTVRLDMTP